MESKKKTLICKNVEQATKTPKNGNKFKRKKYIQIHKLKFKIIKSHSIVVYRSCR